jgi:hypothetical protein
VVVLGVDDGEDGLTVALGGTAGGEVLGEDAMRDGSYDYDGDVQAPTRVGPLPAGWLSIVIAIDWSSSMRPADTDRAQALAGAIVDRAPPGTAIEIIAFSGSVERRSRFDTDRANVEAALDSTPSFPRGETALYDAAIVGIEDLSSAGPARLLIVITDGFDNASSHSLQEVLDRAVRHRVPIVPVATFLADPEVARTLAGLVGAWSYTPDLSAAEDGVETLARALSNASAVTLPSPPVSARELKMTLGSGSATVPLGAVP